MKSVFIVSNEIDFNEWIVEELDEYATVDHIIDSLDFVINQYRTYRSEYLLLTERVVPPQKKDTLANTIKMIQEEQSSVSVVFFYSCSKDDPVIQSLVSIPNVICISFLELDVNIFANLFGVTVNLDEEEEYRSTETIENTTEPKEENLQDVMNKQEQQPVQQEQEEASETDTIEPIEENEEASEVDEELTVNEPHKKPASKASGGQKRKRQDKKRKQKEKIERIKERMIIEREYVRINVPVNYESKTISILSLYPRAGATFVTSNLARFMGENKISAAVVEPILKNQMSTYYDLLQGEIRAPKDWEPAGKQLKRTGYIRAERKWTMNHIHWIAAGIQPYEEWDELDTMKLLLFAKSQPVTICDISAHYEDSNAKQMLKMSDEIWIVTDGDPVQISKYIPRLDKLKKEYANIPIHLIGNRWNKHIKTSDWKEVIQQGSLTEIPELGIEVLGQLWKGKLAWDSNKLKNEMVDPFKPLVKRLVSREMNKRIKMKYGLLNKIMSILTGLQVEEDEEIGEGL